MEYLVGKEFPVDGLFAMGGNLQNKVALVTGAASGIGAAIARRFVAEGARVVLGDLDSAAAGEMAAILGDRAGSAALDVQSEQSFAVAIEEVVDHHGRLDILVNNAGIALPALPVQETSQADFARIIGVNLAGVYLGCKLAYPHLKKTQGCVLNISSMSGVTGQERHAIYGASKGGVNALTQCAAIDWGPDRIRINALCPIGVWTQTLRDWMQAQPDPESIVDYLNRIHALGYCPEAEEIAAVAAFLCGPDAGFVTGCIMPVSGGGECGYNLHRPPGLNSGI